MFLLAVLGEHLQNMYLEGHIRSLIKSDSNTIPFSIFCVAVIGFPGSTVIKNLPANAGDARDPSSIPELGRSPGERNGNLFQYSCLENSMNRRAWQATVHGVQRVRHN